MSDFCKLHASFQEGGYEQTSEGAVSQYETRLAEPSPKRRNGAGLCHWAKALGTDPREQVEDGGTAYGSHLGGRAVM